MGAFFSLGFGGADRWDDDCMLELLTQRKTERYANKT
jgi:hypothetical protein